MLYHCVGGVHDGRDIELPRVFEVGQSISLVERPDDIRTHVYELRADGRFHFAGYSKVAAPSRKNNGGLPGIGLIYFVTQDHTVDHGVPPGAFADMVLISEPAADGEVTAINLHEAAAKYYVPAEVNVEAAMPHDVARWADALESAVTKANHNLDVLRDQVKGSGTLPHYQNASDHLEVRVLAVAVEEARDLAQRLIEIGARMGSPTEDVRLVADEPLNALRPELAARAVQNAKAIAQRA